MTVIEFKKVVSSEAGALRHYAYQLTRNLEDAQDLVQETMLKALSCKNRFQEGTNLKGWLYTIMKNSFINNYRRLMKRNTFIDNTDNTYFIETVSSASGNKGEERFIMKDIETAIESLPTDLQKTFTMHFNGFKYHEIADILHIPIGTVKTRIFVARRIMRHQLKSYAVAYGLNDN